MCNKESHFLFYAPNVHTGGGLILLKAVLKSWPTHSRLIAWLDVRAQCHLNLPANSQVEWVSPTLRSRLKAEISLAKKANSFDRVLCFHGLPPLLCKKASIFVFQQNRNLFGLVPLKTFSLRTRTRLCIEQAVAYLFRHRCVGYWVQTPSMARDLKNWYGDKSVFIRILPFLENTPAILHSGVTKWDFIYVADGEAHKNHRNLVDAWVILASEGLYPSLALTLSNRDASLLAWIQQQVAMHGLRLSNLGQLSHEKLLCVYGQSKALVFPSISESFGLPLLEAHQASLPIVASELDFVRDVCDPVQTFNPHSPTSIARAVRRFIGQGEMPVQPVGANEFLTDIFSHAYQNS